MTSPRMQHGLLKCGIRHRDAAPRRQAAREGRGPVFRATAGAVLKRYGRASGVPNTGASTQGGQDIPQAGGLTLV